MGQAPATEEDTRGTAARGLPPHRGVTVGRGQAVDAEFGNDAAGDGGQRDRPDGPGAARRHEHRLLTDLAPDEVLTAMTVPPVATVALATDSVEA
jgi:hypothetical protein